LVSDTEATRDRVRASLAGSQRAVLPGWLWLGFPPLLLMVIVPIRIVDPVTYSVWIDGELGLIELTTAFLAIIAAIIGGRLLYYHRKRHTFKLRLWIILTTAGCVYFAGEELSWGQHLFRWETPAAIERINDQGETNLHNVSSWFDQKPRLVLEIWVLIGGVIVPLFGAYRGSPLAPEQFRYWFWPTIDCVPAALFAVAVRLPERAKDLFGVNELPFELRYSEPQEYYFALFLMLYLASLSARTEV